MTAAKRPINQCIHHSVLETHSWCIFVDSVDSLERQWQNLFLNLCRNMNHSCLVVTHVAKDGQ